MRLSFFSFFFWLTISLASISHLSPADFDPFETLALRADDAATTTPLTDSSHTTATELIVDNTPTFGLSIGAQDSGQTPEDSIERNQQLQNGLSKAGTSNCRRSHPSGAKRRRDGVNYCPNNTPTTRPARLQQGENVRPTGNLGGVGKPGKNILVSPDEAKPEWAPPLSDFFVTDPCRRRPYRVCAPYVPGRDFEDWTSSVRTLSSLDLTACEFCM